MISRIDNQTNYDSQKRILVIKWGGLGDIILTIPAFRSIAESFPDYKLTLMTSDDSISLFQRQSFFDEVLGIPWKDFTCEYIETDKNKSVPFFEERRFERVYCFADNSKDLNRFLLRSRVPYVYISDNEFPKGPKRHAAEYFHDFVLQAGICHPFSNPHIHLSESELETSVDYLRNLGISLDSPLIGIFPGSRTKGKCWKATRFALLIALLQGGNLSNIILFENKEDSEAVDSVLGELPIHMRPISVSIKNPRYLAAMFAQCSLLICNDSGVMHLAAAVNTPVVALFGPTDYEVWGPLGNINRIVNRRIDICFDCNYDKVSECEKGICFESIRVSDVFQAVEYILR